MANFISLLRIEDEATLGRYSVSAPKLQLRLATQTAEDTLCIMCGTMQHTTRQLSTVHSKTCQRKGLSHEQAAHGHKHVQMSEASNHFTHNRCTLAAPGWKVHDLWHTGPASKLVVSAGVDVHQLHSCTCLWIPRMQRPLRSRDCIVTQSRNPKHHLSVLHIHKSLCPDSLLWRSCLSNGTMLGLEQVAQGFQALMLIR